LRTGSATLAALACIAIESFSHSLYRVREVKREGISVLKGSFSRFFSFSWRRFRKSRPEKA